MSKKWQQLSSQEAASTFKKEIDNCLSLLGFLNSKDKEEIWKFWKTVSLAVKIAVNGKGAITSSPRKDCQNDRRKNQDNDEEELVRLEKLATDATTIYVPLTCTDKSFKRYRVYKFLNEEKIDDYIEIVEINPHDQQNDVECSLTIDKRELSEVDFHSDVMLSPDKFLAQISQDGGQKSYDLGQEGDNTVQICTKTMENSFLCDDKTLVSHEVLPYILEENVSQSNDFSSSEGKLNKESHTSFHSSPPSKKPKTEVKTWPVGKPTTRSSSRGKERNPAFNVVPSLKMKNDRTDNKNSETETVDSTMNSDVGNENLISIVSTEQDIHTNSEETTNSRDKLEFVDSLSGVVKAEKGVEDIQIQTDANISSSENMPHGECSEQVSSEALIPETSNEVNNDSKAESSPERMMGVNPIALATKNISDASSNLIQTPGMSVEVSAQATEMIVETINPATEMTVEVSAQATEMNVEALPQDERAVVINSDVNKESVPEYSVQEVDLRRQVHPKSSDIETIISALEEELKKTGSVHSISITKDPPKDEGIIIQSTESDVVQLLPKQEIMEVQNVEDVIWNADGSVQLVGNHTLIDTTDLVNSTNEEVIIHPMDVQYDVVEYEVLAEKSKSGGGKKRKKDKEPQSDEKDALDRTCPMCHRVLTYPSSMAAHMRIHTGDRPYSCGQCDRKFTTKANRDRHEATHVGLKPFKCTECDKCFTEKRSLKIHMRSHTGERPFVCMVCDRGFTQKCTLMVHMDRHTNRKGHLCDLCGKAFRQKCQLDIHVKRHNRQANYPCPECSVKCYTKGDLMRHMIKHTGERPFHCSVCSRTFTRKQYLMDHENTHFGRKPYKCSVCSVAFHDMGSCHRHVRKHREEEGAGKGGKASKPATILTADDYNTIVKGSEVGKILTLEDGSQAFVTAVDTQADGSTVYHITCVNNMQQDDASESSKSAEDLVDGKEEPLEETTVASSEELQSLTVTTS